MKGMIMRKRASATAIAMALAAGTILAASAIGFAEPAYAQRGKSPYSKEFVAKYTPLSEASKQEGADLAALKPQLLALLAAAANPAEQMAAAGLVYDTAGKLGDYPMQLQGMEALLASGLVEADKLGQYNFIAYQLANNTSQFGKARESLTKVIGLGYTPQGLSTAQLSVLISESFFSENRLEEGLAVLSEAIRVQKSQNQPVDERWYRRGISLSYNNQIRPHVYDFVAGWVGDNPSEENWRDAINLVRNIDRPDHPEMLDLMRLAARLGTINDEGDVIDYVEAADARRSPLEVKNAIETAYAKGYASKDDLYLSESLESAVQRLADDQAALAELEVEADATTTDLKIVMVTADAYYSYGNYLTAERLYTKALTLPGVETQLVLTRLGMAQVELGKLDEGRATLARVEGVRKPIAQLWIAYADDLAGGTVIGG